MATTWPPTKEGELVAYLVAVSATITASPLVYGQTVQSAATFAAAVTALVNAHALCSDPATRTEAAVANKDTCKAFAVSLLRQLNRQVQANPAVTAEQKAEIGFPIYKATRSPRPAPATRPVLSLIGPPSNLAIPVQIVDELTPTKRARPADVTAAEVYSYVLDTPGQQPPEDLELWRFEGLATRSLYKVDYNQPDEGKTTVIRAAWINPRGERGPASAPITAKVAA